MRTLQYNWAWMLQRKANKDQFNVDMKVVVYDKRAHQFLPSASEKVYMLDASQPPIVSGVTTSLKFPAAAAPPVQKGGWILDATVTNIDSSTPGVRNANFYRVVSVTPNGTTVDIELQTPLKDPSGKATGFNPVTQSRFVVLNGIYEVFDLPPLTEFGP